MTADFSCLSLPSICRSQYSNDESPRFYDLLIMIQRQFKMSLLVTKQNENRISEMLKFPSIIKNANKHIFQRRKIMQEAVVPSDAHFTEASSFPSSSTFNGADECAGAALNSFICTNQSTMSTRTFD